MYSISVTVLPGNCFCFSKSHDDLDIEGAVPITNYNYKYGKRRSFTLEDVQSFIDSRYDYLTLVFNPKGDDPEYAAHFVDQMATYDLTNLCLQENPQ